MNNRIEVLPNVFVQPQIIETENGKVEYDMSEGGHPVVLCSHGGIGGLDQARVMVSWLDEAHFTLISPSRPGYLGTPLESGRDIPDYTHRAVLEAVERCPSHVKSAYGMAKFEAIC